MFENDRGNADSDLEIIEATDLEHTSALKVGRSQWHLVTEGKHF